MMTDNEDKVLVKEETGQAELIERIAWIIEANVHVNRYGDISGKDAALAIIPLLATNRDEACFSK